MAQVTTNPQTLCRRSSLCEAHLSSCTHIANELYRIAATYISTEATSSTASDLECLNDMLAAVRVVMQFLQDDKFASAIMCGAVITQVEEYLLKVVVPLTRRISQDVESWDKLVGDRLRLPRLLRMLKQASDRAPLSLLPTQVPSSVSLPYVYASSRYEKNTNGSILPPQFPYEAVSAGATEIQHSSPAGVSESEAHTSSSLSSKYTVYDVARTDGAGRRRSVTEDDGDDEEASPGTQEEMSDSMLQRFERIRQSSGAVIYAAESDTASSDSLQRSLRREQSRVWTMRGASLTKTRSDRRTLTFSTSRR